MKIDIKPSPDVADIEISIRYKEENEELDHIVALLGTVQQTIIGRQDEKSYPLRPLDIFYFESVDNRVYAYTENDTFEVKLKLYELEQLLDDAPFVRVSISTIINTQKIDHFKTSINGKMESYLKNGDIVSVSRNYVPQMKLALGGRLK